MQVTVEAVSNIERKMTVVVPIEMVDAAFNKRLVKLSQTAKLNGYRKGKIPLTVVKQRFGDTARQEALSEVIQSSLNDAILKEKLNPASIPTVEPKKISAHDPLEYVATFEIVPELHDFKFDLPEIEKDTTSVTAADLSLIIDSLKTQHTTYSPVERAAQLNDQVIIDFTGSIDGTKFKGGEAKKYPIILGSKTMIPGFEDGIIGMKAGETRVVSVNFPTEYFAPEFSGKGAEFEIVVHQVNEPKLPEIDENFIKKIGIQSGKLEDLEFEIRKNLEKEVTRLTKLKLKEKVFSQLIEQNPLDIPKALIEAEAKRIHDRMHPAHTHGHDHHHTEEENASFKTAAKRQVALGLILAEIMKKHAIVCDQARVDQYIVDISNSYEDPKQLIDWYSKDKKRRMEIEMQVLEDQVIEKLLEGVKVVEKPVSYQEFIGHKINSENLS